MDLETGKTIGTQLTLVRALDGGAMGAVWVATHRTLRTEVAVKFVDPKLISEDPAALSRFRHEASASARLKSPHVVQVFDHDFTIDGTPYIVMELLEGETLKQRLDRGPLSFAEAAQVVTHVARALSRAHKLGVIHRDIKPENIFLCKMEDELFCKLFDFGIAKQTQLPELDQLTHPGLLVGTPEFMSPELFSNKRDVDRFADLWALAAVTYYALCKKLPFPGDNVGELCTNLMTKEAPPISSLRDDAPPELDAWFERALAKTPDERFATARELAKTFVRAVAGASMPDEVSRFSNPDLSAEAAQAFGGVHLSSGRPLSQSSSAPFTVDSGDADAARTRRSRLIAFAAVAALAAAAAVVATRMVSSPTPAAAPAPAAPVEDEGAAAAASAEPSAEEASEASGSAEAVADAAPSASASAEPTGEAQAASPAAASAPAKAPMPRRAPGSSGYDWAF